MDAVYFRDTQGENSLEAQYFSISGLKCQGCVTALEGLISQHSEVNQVKINFITESMSIKSDRKYSVSMLNEFLEPLGYRASSLEQSYSNLEPSIKKSKIRLSVAVCFGMWTLAFSFVKYFSPDLTQVNQGMLGFVLLLVSYPVVSFAALDIYRMAYLNLKNKLYSMDVLITLGVFSSWTLSTINLINNKMQVYYDTCVMLVMVTLVVRQIQSHYKNKKQQQIKKWQQEFPKEVLLADHAQDLIPIEQVKAGDRLVIRPGTPIYFDAQVLEGKSEIDYSDLHGEPFLELAVEGDLIKKGGVNRFGKLTVKISETQPTAYPYHLETKLRKVLTDSSVEIGYANKLTGFLFKSGFVLAVLQALIYLNTLEVDGAGTYHDLVGIILATLLVTCPCSVALILPMTLANLENEANIRGIKALVPKKLLSLSKVKHVFLDKTGTVTERTLTISHFSETSDLKETPYSLKEIAEIVFEIETHINHPIAQSLVNWARDHLNNNKFDKNELEKKLKFSNIQLCPGVGVSAKRDGDEFMISALRNSTGTQELVSDGPKQKAVALYKNDVQIFVWYFREKIRPDFKQFLDFLDARQIGYSILSGDSQKNVTEFTKQAKFKGKALGSLSPEGKSEIVSQYPNSLMIGDGSNDAIAIAKAGCSVAINPKPVLECVAAAEISTSKSDLVFNKIQNLFHLVARANQALTLSAVLFMVYFILMNILIAYGAISPIIVLLAPLFLLMSCVFHTHFMMKRVPQHNFNQLA